MNYFLISQNNSKGHYVVNDNVCASVAIQADNQQDAIDKFISLGGYDGYKRGDCRCCGQRWDFDDFDQVSLDDAIADANDWIRTSPNIIIHHADGTKQSI